jgi:hypothetical protein
MITHERRRLCSAASDAGQKAMSNYIYVPKSLKVAGRELRLALTCSLEILPKDRFIRAWSSIAYLFPGLHPDGFDDPDSGWPRVLRRFAAEAWRRADAGEFCDEQLYCCDAQWSGLYDRMFSHTPDEMERRLALAANFGESLDG